MTLTLYNTLTRKKEPFEPIDRSNVRMYVCGPTVYDFAHIGNARPVIVFDVLFRLLRHIYGPEHVTYARNITDVDDKINARAVERYPDLPPAEAIAKLTVETTRQFHDDIRALGVLMPEDVNQPGQRPVFIEPRATEHIEEMRRLCEALVANGHAYVGQDHVLFDVSSMPDYGRLANRSLEEMEAGARVDVAPYKKGPMDFVLWKPSKPGEPAWPSPCGIAAPGRPGWHLECSAMSDRWLWEEAKGSLTEAGLAKPHVFDIHGGGIDLVFPHHENEVAQSRCGHGTSVMANYWLHNGFLQVEGEKMSKSLGNFVTIRELLDGWSGFPWRGDAIRLAMLSAHYRQPIDWTRARLLQAVDALDRWSRVGEGMHPADDPSLVQKFGVDVRCSVMEAILADDLNTPEAIAHIHRLAHEAGGGDDGARVQMHFDLALLGIDLRRHKRDWSEILRSAQHVDEAKVAELISARSAARKAKDFKEADRIRDELSAMSIQLMDKKDPATSEIVTTWQVKR